MVVSTLRFMLLGSKDIEMLERIDSSLRLCAPLVQFIHSLKKTILSCRLHCGNQPINKLMEKLTGSSIEQGFLLKI